MYYFVRIGFNLLFFLMKFNVIFYSESRFRIYDASLWFQIYSLPEIHLMTCRHEKFRAKKCEFKEYEIINILNFA